jgi:hypothetical protein
LSPVEVGVHVSDAGSYMPPSLNSLVEKSPPPQTIMRLPVHTAVCPARAAGTFSPVEVGVQASAAGS